MTWISLRNEPSVVAAVALDERNGFVPTGPFGDYTASDHNRFFTLALSWPLDARRALSPARP